MSLQCNNINLECKQRFKMISEYLSRFQYTFNTCYFHSRFTRANSTVSSTELSVNTLSTELHWFASLLSRSDSKFDLCLCTPGGLNFRQLGADSGRLHVCDHVTCIEWGDNHTSATGQSRIRVRHVNVDALLTVSGDPTSDKFTIRCWPV